MITRTKQPVYDDLVALPTGTDLDTVTKEGTYKVNNYKINGVNYDGTLVVLPWDSHYFRQIFYTIDNNNPNPIFTRVRVNITSKWKEWHALSQRKYIGTAFSEPRQDDTTIEFISSYTFKRNTKYEIAIYDSQSLHCYLISLKTYDDGDFACSCFFPSLSSYTNGKACYCIMDMLTNKITINEINDAQLNGEVEEVYTMEIYEIVGD